MVDIRAGGVVDLDGAAEPCAMPLAGFLVCREVNGDRVVLAVPGGAAPAGGGGADGRAPVVTVPGECGERVPQGGFASSGESGQVMDVRGLRLAGGGEVVAGGGPGGEPWREAGGDGAGRQVAGGRGARQVGGDRLAAERGGAERERPGGNAYDELRDQLCARGAPREAIRFTHQARTDREKGELFAACRAGGIAVLIGSTEKMGVGTNVRTRAVAFAPSRLPVAARRLLSGKAGSCGRGT